MDLLSIVLTGIQTLLSIVACILAWIIPKRIMWQETYSSLIADYRSYDFAVAVQGIIEFFKVDCDSDTGKIKTEYEKRFVEDILDEDKDPALCLHYQRRLLAQFFYQLDLCTRWWPIRIGKKRVRDDFTTGEASLVRLVLLMDEAIEKSKIIWQDISCVNDVPVPVDVKGINQNLSHIYSILQKSGRHIRSGK